MSSRNGNMERVLKAAQAHGFRLVEGRKHSKLYNDSGKVVTVSSTPSDSYAWKQVWRDIRREFGVALPI